MRTLQIAILERKSSFLVFLVLLMISPFFLIPSLYEKLPVKVVGALDVSLPYNFFFEYPSSELKRGDYVEVYVEDMNINFKGMKVRYLLKKIACGPGDHLLARKGKFYCNGKLLGVAHPEAPRHPIEYDGVVPEGHYFVMGTHPRSFDSRYIGLIDKERIRGKLIPLF